MEQMRRVRHILLVVLGLNIAVALAKVVYGWLSGSLSMTADGFHSLSDGASNLIGLVGVWIASIPADENHPYGHKKFETFTTVGIAALLLFVGFEVVLGAVNRMGGAPTTPNISTASFVVMLITLAVNIGVYTYEHRAGKKLGSDFLVSDALHTRSDILVSLAVIGGLVGVKLGLPWLDWVLSLVIAVLIFFSAWEIIKNSAQVLCDAAVLDPAVVVPVVQDIPGVEDCHMVRSRGRSDEVYVDLHLTVDPAMTVGQAHMLAHIAECRLKGKIPGVVDVLVHVEPRDEAAQ
ncbi:MAG TPA: cation diffusion facilitator family transporter [Symbiobacteriaceae bacterium]|nr:cation diffusion facilitator family transporter [Symbiobacteriaceae bacterium]